MEADPGFGGGVRVRERTWSRRAVKRPRPRALAKGQTEGRGEGTAEDQSRRI